MKILIFICILGTFRPSYGTSATEWSKECTFGPAYWCGSLMTAKECNAVTHCIQTVWEKQALPEDNDDICTICKDMIKQARDQLLSNETQELIREVFEGSCKLIPIPLISDECIRLSDEYIPELIDTLASQMNPQIVCATVGLCNSARIDKMLAKFKGPMVQVKVEDSKELSTQRDCDDCKRFTVDVLKQVKSLSRAELLDRILTMCGRLGSLSDGCMSLVQTNFQFIYDFLTQDLNADDFCDFLGMCERMYGNVHVSLPRTGDETCDFCVAIINSWRNNLVANTTKDELKMILDGLCEHTGGFSKECLSLVDQYFEVLYDILVSDIHAKEICEAVGLCGSNALFKDEVPVWSVFGLRPEDHLPMLEMTPSIDFTGQDEAASYNTDVHLPRVSLTKSDINIVSLGEKGLLMDKPDKKVEKTSECIMCEFVLHFLQNLLNGKETREQLKQALDEVCNLLPHSVAEQCQDYVDAYGDQIIQLLILEIDPSVICPMIHMCPGANLATSGITDNVCVLCEFVMTELDQIIGDKKNEDAVKAALEQVCSYMPKSVKSQCKAFIDTYIDQIVDLIINDVTPAQVCTALGLCNGSKGKDFIIDPNTAQLPISRLFIPNLVEDPLPEPVTEIAFEQTAGCAICEFIMVKVDDVLRENSTERDFARLLRTICLILPSTLREDCVGLVETYSSMIIEELITDLKPSLVCRNIKLCKDNLLHGMFKTEVTLPVDKCLVCEEVVNWISEHMNDKKIVDLVESVLDNVCNVLPESSKNECIKMVTYYGDFLRALLEELSDSKKVCQALKLCPHHGTQQLLGSKKCSWGPGYWCQSQMHASACKATKHCKERVWIDSIPAF